MSIAAALGPEYRATHRLVGASRLAGTGGHSSRHMAMSEPRFSWIADGRLGRQLEQPAVDVGAEDGAVVGDLAQLRPG